MGMTMSLFRNIRKIYIRKKVLKLHKQFGHSNFLKQGNISTKEISSLIKNVVSEFQTYKNLAPRTVVGVSKSTDFDVAAILYDLWYLHIFDEFSNYHNRGIIKSKNKCNNRKFPENLIKFN